MKYHLVTLAASELRVEKRIPQPGLDSVTVWYAAMLPGPAQLDVVDWPAGLYLASVKIENGTAVNR